MIIRACTPRSVRYGCARPKSGATKQRFAELTRRREAVQTELEKHLETSVELETQRDELRQMQQVANDMTVQLEKMDIDLSAPDRIRQIGGEAIIESRQFAAQ